ncbi:neuropeptide receptor B3 [Aphomia sociella]
MDWLNSIEEVIVHNLKESVGNSIQPSGKQAFMGIGSEPEQPAENYYSDGLSPVREALDVWHPRNTRLAIRTNQLDCERPDVYICEEPHDVVPLDDGRACNFRNGNYHEQIFRWVAGWGCLVYTPDFLYVGGVNSINMSASCLYEHRWAPCLELAKEDGTCGCYPFDPGLEQVVNAIENALVPSAQRRWEKCYYKAKECCSEYLMEDTIPHNETRCGTTFDGWTCWRGAIGGTIANEICSEFAYSNSGPTCHHFSSKQCHANGTWELQTDYSTCSIAPRLLRRYRFHIAMLSFSIASCLPAVIIFFFYKRLRITRVALHRNLLIAIIIRNILVIISRSEIYIDELTNAEDTVLSNHNVACRILSLAERIAVNAVFICMLIEGVYLHRLIVAVFKRKLKINWLYGIGSVIAIVPVIAWAVVMGIHDDHSCWLIYTIGYIQWILDAPRVAILLINTILFVDVMRVLLTKVRNSENANQLNTAKATLFLMPIFGVQFLLTAFRPNTTNCTGEQIYYYVAYTVEGLQGFIVAMLYCYVNKEVHMLIKATYRKTESAVVSRVRRDSTYPRMSTNQNSDRRLTYSTGLASQHMDDVKNDYATIKPKLHVAEIISIQASERLADILEPVYETIENCAINEGFTSEKSDVENDSECIAGKESKVDDYYGFTNASSVSIDNPDWIRAVSSPCSSVYNNSQNDSDAKHLENKNRNYDKVQDNDSRKRKSLNDNSIKIMSDNSPSIKNDNKEEINSIENNIDNSGNNNKTVNNKLQESAVEDNASDYEDSESMLDEIMQYIESNDTNCSNLNPDLLSPNRKEDDKIIFVNE